MAVRRDVRRSLTAAALDLFLAQGFDETTVDQIAEAAGVARRTFFRHFRVKEDAIFPDHDAVLREIVGHLEAASPLVPPLTAVTEAALMVVDTYATDPETSVKRYELTRRVPSLREHEIGATSRYQRAFTAFLNERDGADEPRRLRHEVISAAVVTTHNHVLRAWLRGGGTGDVRAELTEALSGILAGLQPWLDDRDRPREVEDDVLIVVTRRGTPLWKIAQEIEAAG
ncbi:TetR family transcriptional regulator [Microtetraspora sp. NBRC 16547]|uniref:TetR family transcriptional regulator n=1 Tax=Microtetraspora sp. NBRC 16547 TaxID=3030993 RepID=UPI0024A1965F|nr:TetR family transcriptional regulator [Microtetraspora sp. NBRC 16547]GLW96094.1 TetR family transcriptional regulator [Microtetraspora sp. NBRC 16547]